MTNLRLLYLAGIDLPMPQARAVQSLHTARALAAQGCHVTLAVGRAPRMGPQDALADYGLTPHQNLRIISLPSLRLPRLAVPAYVHPRLAAWNWSYGLSALLAARLLPTAWRPDFILARDPRLAWLFLRAGGEVVYEVHELFSTRAREPATGEGEETPRTRTPRIRGLEAEVLARVHRVFTLTQSCKLILERGFGVPAERILVAPDAVAHVPERLAPLPKSNVVVYAGQLYPWKGVGTLVDAMSSLPSARLRIVGGLPDEDDHGRALKALVSQRGLDERVEFTGFVPHAEMAAALADGAAGAIPLPDAPMSRYFTSPLKLFEYMAAGLPIAASDLPALREVLGHEQNALLVPPDDPPALAANLDRLLRDRRLAERLRKQAHRDVGPRTWEARATAILAFLS